MDNGFLRDAGLCFLVSMERRYFLIINNNDIFFLAKKLGKA